MNQTRRNKIKSKKMLYISILLTFLVLVIGLNTYADYGMVYLGPTNINDNFKETTPAVADGDTVGVDPGQSGVPYREFADPNTDHYMYFSLFDDFAYQGNHPTCTIKFQYWDFPNTEIRLQYDATSSTYKNHPTVITTGGTNTWKLATFELTNAYFGNRQNSSSDLRLYAPGTRQIHIDKISVNFP